MSFPQSPHDRYHRDPAFRQLVDTLYLQLEQCQFTGTELREAAILAAILLEERREKRTFYYDAERIAPRTRRVVVHPSHEMKDGQCQQCMILGHEAGIESPCVCASSRQP